MGRLVRTFEEALPVPENQFLRESIEVCLRYALMQGAAVQNEYVMLWETLRPGGDHLATFHTLFGGQRQEYGKMFVGMKDFVRDAINIQPICVQRRFAKRTQAEAQEQAKYL